MSDRLLTKSRGATALLWSLAVALAPAIIPTLAYADAPAPPPKIDSGDTAWMMTSMALVLLMTIPGLALFYAGMVRSKNVLATMMQCFAITALVTVLWTIYGYSMAFSSTGMTANVVNFNSFVGAFDKVMLHGVTRDSITLTIPETVFMCFQMTFAIITPALIVGAFAERMKFSALLWFMGLWLTLCYCPIAHMVWGGAGSFLGDMGVLDFAGGTVVHINAGIAGLVACLVMGKRKGYPGTAMAPHNLGYTVIGASLLWVGWFGFNAGSAVAANQSAGMAMAVTQIATAAAALAWMAAEKISHGKASVLGAASGAVAGLVAITPASGSAGPEGALIIGVAVGVICFLASTKLKRALGYDDSLDAFGVHCIGGIVGAILTGLCAAPFLGGAGLSSVAGDSVVAQLLIQAKAVIVTLVYTGVVSFIILKVLDMTMGLRVTEEQEVEGLDLALHDERGYNL
jgi:ammonium transporter, Amt family